MHEEIGAIFGVKENAMAKQRIGAEKGKRLALKAGLNPDEVASVWGRGDRRQVEIYTQNGGFYTMKRGGEVKCIRRPAGNDDDAGVLPSQGKS